MTLKTRIILASATTGIAALASMAGLVAFAAAAELPTITASVQNSSNATITSAIIGSSVHANVVVASTTASTSPTGTVDFNLYSNQTCSGSPLAQTGVNLVNGAASSSNIIVAAGGLSYRVHYNGQGDLYTGGDSACVSITAGQIAPAISLSLSNSNIQVGSFVYGIPNLTGESATASGTLQYNVYSNNTCSALSLNGGAKIVTNGATPNSDSFQFNTVGTYYWQVAYSGDLNNTPATSSCGTVLTVVATSTPTTTPSGPGTINGNVFNDLNKNGGHDVGEAGLVGWTITLHKAPTIASSTSWMKRFFKKHNGYNDPIVATATTDSNGNYTFGSLGNGQYFVEEQVQTGWKQTSSDKKIVLDSTHTSGIADFANVQKATTTGQGNHGKGHEGNDNDNDDRGHGGTSSTTASTTVTHQDGGEHRGWFNINANIMSWFQHGKGK